MKMIELTDAVEMIPVFVRVDAIISVKQTGQEMRGAENIHGGKYYITEDGKFAGTLVRTTEAEYYVTETPGFIAGRMG